MNFKFFKSCDDFVKYYFSQNMNITFELVLEQFEKDECYLDDTWIKWCVAEFEMGDGVIPMGVIGFRKTEESDHISSFNVNLNYRRMGFGASILTEFMNNYCSMPYITLYAERKNKLFYEKLGFKEVFKDYYRKENKHF